MTSKVDHLMTVADLEALPDDGNIYELIEGELFVSRAPGLPHQLVLNNLLFEVTTFLRNNPIGRVVPSPGVIFSNYDSVIPDVLVVANERWDEIVANDRFIAAPNLIVEILSPGASSRERDLDIKRRLYGKYGVEEYWVVDTTERSVVVFRLKNAQLEVVGTIRNDETLSSDVLPGFELKLSSLFEL